MSENNLSPEEARVVEGDALAGLLAAVEDQQNETLRITIKRKGKTYFSFRVRPLDDEQYKRCQEQSTTYDKRNSLGIRMPKDNDPALYRHLLIYAATVKEDQEQLWDNRELWNQLDCLSGIDVIERALKPGEKEAVVAKIDELSGYGADLEETAKN